MTKTSTHLFRHTFATSSKYFLLLFGEGVSQRIPSPHTVVQSLGVWAAAFEAALTGANVTEVKILREQHFGAPSAVDELVQYDLFRTA